jgi:hypothetical protein
MKNDVQERRVINIREVSEDWCDRCALGYHAERMEEQHMVVALQEKQKLSLAAITFIG